MQKPVNKEEFWRERLNNSAKLEHSVYITSEKDWNFINKTHLELLMPYQYKKVLDAGCGYGRWSELFSDYTGTDFSSDFINKAIELHPDKKFVKANMKKLPFKDDEFDLSFCVSIKDMIVDNLGEVEWAKMFEELKRVSKKVMILEYTNPDEYEVHIK